MMDQIKEMTAVITKADIAMKAATWQIERLMEDVAMLSKAGYRIGLCRRGERRLLVESDEKHARHNCCYASGRFQMNCAQCAKSFNSADLRLRLELRGICLDCAEANAFAGMTLEETARCVSMLKVIADYKKQTPEQARHLKDMES
jgi:hypothetical protein